MWWKKKLSFEEKTDAVLKEFVDKSNSAIMVVHLFKSLDIEFEDDDPKNIITQLLHDGYIEDVLDIAFNQPTGHTFTSADSGIIFLRKGGYKLIAKKQRNERNWKTWGRALLLLRDSVFIILLLIGAYISLGIIGIIDIDTESKSRLEWLIKLFT